MSGVRVKKEGKEKDFTIREFEKPFETALYYGFVPVRTLDVQKEDVAKLKSLRDHYDPKRIQAEAPFSFDPLEKIALLRSYEEFSGTQPGKPFLIAYKKPISGTFTKKPSEFILGLESFGLQTSCAEALMIRTALSILEDEGHENLSVMINSLGDKDSVSDFERMVGGFVRKHMNGFPADIRKMAKHDIFDILRSTEEKHAPIQDQAPKSLSFLSEQSRNHFQEVLEYLEALDIPYQIAPRLIGSPSFCSHTIFEIWSGSGTDKTLVVHGYRYSRLAKKIGMKREVASLGASILLKKKEKRALVKPPQKKKFYLIQLGFGAKLFSLIVLEALRKARISVAHSIPNDKIGSQLGTAENSRAPFILIIGQKEAIDRSVSVRNANTRAQETVPLDRLIDHLKKLG